MDAFSIVWLIVTVVMYLQGLLLAGVTATFTKPPKYFAIPLVLCWPVLLPVWLFILYRKYGQMILGVIKALFNA